MPTDPRHHATHDAELVAAYAAGDANGADLAAAEDLVAGCAECATLHRDLRAIMAALPAMPAPVRSRDFRLTPEQAAAIRPPSALRRLLAPLAGARFAFAGPAGAGLAALGLAGILLGGGLNVQPPSAGAGDKAVTTGGTPAVLPAASGESAAVNPASPGGIYGALDQSASSAAPSAAAASMAPSAAPSAAASTAPSVPSTAPSVTSPTIGAAIRPGSTTSTAPVDNTARYGTPGGLTSLDGTTTRPEAPVPSAGAAALLDVAAPSTPPVVWLGLGFIVAGLLLVGARWTARRFG